MEWIDNVLRDVAELPDRNSPEDWPDAMLVTGAELRQIIVTHAPAEPVNARLLDALKQAHVALIGYLPEHSNAVTNAAIESARAAIAAAEPQLAGLIRAFEAAVLELNGINPQAKGD